MDGMVRVLYRMTKIRGTDVNVFECGESPSLEWGSDPGTELFNRTFNTDNSNKNVFYEAIASGSNTPFHTSKTPPTDDELLFQMDRPGGGNTDTEFVMKAISYVMAGAFLIAIAAPFVALAPILIPILIIAFLYKTLFK